MPIAADIVFENVNIATMCPKLSKAYGAIENAVLATKDGNII